MWASLVNVTRRRLWLGLLGTSVLLGSCLALPTVATADPFHPQPAAAVIAFQPRGTPKYTDPYSTPSELWDVSAQSDSNNCSADCWGNAQGTGNEASDGWVYLTVTRGASTIATSSANNGGAAVTVRGLEIGDTVTVYAKPAVYKSVPGCLDCNPPSGFEGYVPSSDPYHVAATATFQPGPVITGAKCGPAHPHTEVSGSPGVGATNVALGWDGIGSSSGSHAAAASVSGDSFTATNPHVVIVFGSPVCTMTGAVAGIRYESDPDGVVQVSEYAPSDSIYETGFLDMGRGASLIAPRYGTSAPLKGSRLATVIGAFCSPAQKSACRVNVTGKLPSAHPIVGRSVVTIYPGGHSDLKLTFTSAGVREVRARLRSTARGFSLPLTISFTGTGRTRLLLHTSVFILR
jgi:hypothetical protein